MGKSAKILGQIFGLTAQEMNFFLREEGFLQGNPGNYTVTEKGKKYAREQEHHRGTGGYAHYNRYWTTRTWDDAIANELDITEDRKIEIKQAKTAAKIRSHESEVGYVPVEDEGYKDEYLEENKGSGNFVKIVSVLFVVVSIYGIHKVAPYIKRDWN